MVVSVMMCYFLIGAALGTVTELILFDEPSDFKYERFFRFGYHVILWPYLIYIVLKENYPQ